MQLKQMKQQIKDDDNSISDPQAFKKQQQDIAELERKL